MKLKKIHSKFTRYFLSSLLFLCALLAFSQPSTLSPDGFAASQGTTGGGNATPQTVSSASAFRSAVSGDSQAVIIVNGRFDLGGDVTIGSNKTIKGMNQNSGLYGGAVKIQGTNYIIQNLTFGPTSGDVMEISGATNAFVTKCTFHDSTDELFSIVRQADYVTVSWCRFYFDSPDSHSYAHLIGNGDDVTADRGKLHVTMHHNWYDDGVQGRMPRVRFGEVHIYNNYWNSNNTDYCIGTGKECHVRVENSHFDNVDDPWSDYGGSSDGEIGWSNLLFDGSSQPTYMSNSYPVFSVPYSYSLDAVNSVESNVKAGAGNVISSGGSTTDLTIQENETGFCSVDGTVDNNNAGFTGNGFANTTNASNSGITWSVNAPSSGTYALVWRIANGGTTNRTAQVIVNGSVAVSNVDFGATGSWTTWATLSSINVTLSAGTNSVRLQATNTSGLANIDYLGVNGNNPTATSCASLTSTFTLTDASQLNSESEIIAYPIPVKNILTIVLNQKLENDATIQLYNTIGRLVVNDKIKSNKQTFNISKLPSGLYLLKVSNSNKSTVKRIVKN